MIGKLLSKNPTSDINSLYNLISSSDDEHVLKYIGIKNLISSMTSVIELRSVCSACIESKNPVLHILLSWNIGEQPSFYQVDEAVNIVMTELNMIDHPAVYSLHFDKNFYHIHLITILIHPDKLISINPSNGWTYTAIQRAIKNIESIQGWELSGEKYKISALYNRDNQSIFIRNELISGQISAINIAKNLIKNCEYHDWKSFHSALANHGLRYEKRGRGGVIFVENTPIKASNIDRSLSFSTLENTLGPYVPADISLDIKQLETSQPISSVNDNEIWRLYIAERGKYIGSKMVNKNQLNEFHQKELQGLSQLQDGETDRLLTKRNWHGQYDQLIERRKLLGAKHRAELAMIRERQKRQRKEHTAQFKTFPSYYMWLMDRGEDALAEQWRTRSVDLSKFEYSADKLTANISRLLEISTNISNNIDQARNIPIVEEYIKKFVISSYIFSERESKVDISRIDAAACSGLRADGYEANDIKKAIVTASDSIRKYYDFLPADDINDYAEIAVKFAFCPFGKAIMNIFSADSINAGTEKYRLEILSKERDEFIVISTRSIIDKIKADQEIKVHSCRAAYETTLLELNRIKAEAPEAEGLSERLFGISRRRIDEYQSQLADAQKAVDAALYDLNKTLDLIECAERIAEAKNNALAEYSRLFPDKIKELITLQDKYIL